MRSPSLFAEKGLKMEKYSIDQKSRPQLSTFLAPDSTPELAYWQRINSAEFNCLRKLHSHTDVVEFVLIKKGSSDFLIDGQKIQVSKGDLVIYNSNIVHAENFSNEQNIVLYCCAIRGLHLENLRENAFVPDHETPVFATGEYFLQMKRLIELLFFIKEKPLKHNLEMLSSLVYAFLWAAYDVVTRPENANHEPINYIYQRITAFLDEHYKEDLSVQTIADAINVSAYYMCHVFKENSGFSPLQYIIQRRLGEAQTLLEHTELTATQIGSIVGFPNPSYFNYIFRKKVGMSPLQYRKIYTFSKDEESE